LLSAALLGCAPRCERTCKKLLKCEGLDSDRIALDECELSCRNQLSMFNGWKDEEKLEDAFADHRRCIVRSSCGEIAAGECYDPLLFSVGDNPVTADDTGVSVP
jgi:hypothetical protein